MVWSVENARGYRVSGWLLPAAVTLTLLAAVPIVEAAPPKRTRAVASEAPDAARAALAQLARGGTAADAAITAALVAGVVNASSSGIGGGGFALIWDATAGAASVLDFRETAPAGVDVAAFDQRPFSAAESGRAVGVPGEVAGLFALHRKHGKLPWRDLVRPAADLARNGFRLGRHVARVVGWSSGNLAADVNLRASFLTGQSPLPVGSRVTSPKLARTLEAITERGPAAFYEGPIAGDLVKSTVARGGALSAADLAGYRPVERAPLAIEWEGSTVYTMPPPSAGGLMLAQALRLYSRAELRRLGYGTAAYQHMLAEAFRGSVSDRMRALGDPGFERVDIEALVSRERMARRRAWIAVDRTHALPRFTLEEHGTHHLVTADAEGNVISLTTTVNTGFGADFTSTDSGVILNDELDDFTAQSSVAPYGMPQSPNRARPGARPVSSMTPTIVVRDGRVTLALGGSGGMSIATNVAQVALARLAFDLDPTRAVSDPRIGIPTNGAFIRVPAEASAEHVADLERRGEIVERATSDLTAVQMIAIETGSKYPAADPRKFGSGITD